MPGKVLGLDISEESVTAVQVLSGMRGYRVIACASVPLNEAEGLEKALDFISQQMDLRTDICIVSIPGDHISFRNLRMPFLDSKKIKQTLLFEMETIIPFAIDDVIVDFNITKQTNESEILAVSLKKSRIAEYLATLKIHGVDPDIMDIQSVPTATWLLRQEGIPENGLFIEMGNKRNTIILFLQKRIALMRIFTSNGTTPIQTTTGNRDMEGIDPLQAEQAEAALKSFCKTIQNTIHAFGWQHNQQIYPEKIFFSETRDMDINTNAILHQYLGIPVERINIRGDKRVRMEDYLSRIWDSSLMDRALALTLRDNKKGHGFNFRKGEFEVTKRYVGFKKEIRKIGIFLGIVLLFLIIDLAMDYHLLKKQYETSDQQMVELYRQVFPNEKKVIRPLDQMRVRVNEVKNSAVSLPGIKMDHKVVDLLRDISERIPTSLDVRITNMVIDQTTARMSGETDTFNTVDGIKSSLGTSNYFNNVTISSAKLDRSGKRVQFEMKLERTNQ